MAMQNDTNRWIFAEAFRHPDSMDIQMRAAIKSVDGWVKVLDLMQDGFNSTSLPTRRQLLENIQHNVTLQLAELTLEET